MKMILGVAMMIFFCTVNTLDPKLEALSRGYFEGLDLNEIDNILSCIQDYVWENWKQLYTSLKEIEDFEEASEIIYAFAKLITPCLTVLMEARNCDAERINPIINAFKTILNDSKKMIQKIKLNVDLISQGFKDMIIRWENSNYKEYGRIAGAIINIVFIH